MIAALRLQGIESLMTQIGRMFTDLITALRLQGIETRMTLGGEKSMFGLPTFRRLATLCRIFDWQLLVGHKDKNAQRQCNGWLRPILILATGLTWQTQTEATNPPAWLPVAEWTPFLQRRFSIRVLNIRYVYNIIFYRLRLFRYLAP